MMNSITEILPSYPACVCVCMFFSSSADSVMKSCSFKSFCDKSHMSNGGMKLECCFSDECNGPHRAHSHGEHGNGAVALGSSLNLLLGVLIIRAAVNAV